jgi:hypothetical protein
MRRRGRVKVEAIDIDLVLEEKYPNRKVERELAAMASLLTSGPVEPEFEGFDDDLAALGEDPAADDFFAGAAGSDLDLTVAGPDPDAEPDPTAASDPAPRRRRRPTAASRRIPFAPPAAAPAWVPLPCEPDDDALFAPTARAPLPARVPAPSGPASPYEQLRRRRDRVARQAVDAFALVHDLRTAALRKASQAEHRAALAATARSRAARIAREDRPSGRTRAAEVPGPAAAFDDVHRLRVEALRGAAAAEHGADAVARARERAHRLLEEQRRLEAEMSRLRRGGGAEA